MKKLPCFDKIVSAFVVTFAPLVANVHAFSIHTNKLIVTTEEE
jgi:hypothetical protein